MDSLQSCTLLRSKRAVPVTPQAHSCRGGRRLVSNAAARPFIGASLAVALALEIRDRKSTKSRTLFAENQMIVDLSATDRRVPDVT
jgi:hypothetical protein